MKDKFVFVLVCKPLYNDYVTPLSVYKILAEGKTKEGEIEDIGKLARFKVFPFSNNNKAEVTITYPANPESPETSLKTIQKDIVFSTATKSPDVWIQTLDNGMTLYIGLTDLDSGDNNEQDMKDISRIVGHEMTPEEQPNND